MKTIQLLAGLLMCLAFESLVTPCPAQPPQQTHAEYGESVRQADARIENFRQAHAKGSPLEIKKAALDLQSDPLAVQRMNANSPEALKIAHNKVTEPIKQATEMRIRKAVAKKYGVDVKDVEVFKATNPQAPGAPTKVPQDWDVTVRVKGKDIPASEAKPIVDESYYRSAGGQKTFGKGATPSSVAKRQHIEVTDAKHPESYGGTQAEGKQILEGPKSQPVKDPEQLSKAIKHKSHTAPTETEQIRQATKQYDKQVKPRVEAMGGKVPPKLAEEMEILRKVETGKASPAEVRKELAAKGTTPEEVIKKSGDLPEAAQKLKKAPPDKVLKKPQPDRAGEAKKAAADWAKGAVIMGQADKVRKGIQEEDTEQALSGVLGQDTAKRLTDPGAAALDRDMDQATKDIGRMVDSELEGKLRRMGGTQDEAHAYTEARSRGDAAQARKIVEEVQSRGGTDSAPRRPLDSVSLKDETSALDPLIEGVQQAKDYTVYGVEAVAETASLGGLSRGREAQRDLDAIEREAEAVLDKTETSVNQQLQIAVRERGATKEEAEAYVEARERGDMASRQQILEDVKDRGDWVEKTSGRGLETPDSMDIQEDESWGERFVDGVGDTAKGLKETFLDTPIKVAADTGRDLGEIASGLTEEGVLRELIEERDPREHWEINRQTEETQEEQRQDLIDYLKDLGASDVGAKRAADAAVDDGDFSDFRRLAATRKERNAEEEANQEGDDEVSAEDSVEGIRAESMDSAGVTADADPDTVSHSSDGLPRELDGYLSITEDDSGELPSELDGYLSITEDDPDGLPPELDGYLSITEDDPDGLPPELDGYLSITEDDPDDTGLDRSEYSPSASDMPGEWLSEGPYTGSDYEVGTRIIDDAGIEHEKTDDGLWEKTGDTYEAWDADTKQQWHDSLREAEPASSVSVDDDSFHGKTTLDAYSGLREEGRHMQVATASGLMQQSHDMDRAASAGDQQAREAAIAREAAGREAGMTADESARKAAQAARESGWGKTLGDAMESGIQAGGEAFGSTLGAAAADKAVGQIFGSTREDKSSAPAEEAAPATSASVASAPAASAPSAPRSSDRSSAPKEEKSGSRSSRDRSSGESAGPKSTKGPMVTCPACARTFEGIAGRGVPCPYCVTMNCPVCGYKKTYDRGKEPPSCPQCARRAREERSRPPPEPSAPSESSGEGSSYDD